MQQRRAQYQLNPYTIDPDFNTRYIPTHHFTIHSSSSSQGGKADTGVADVKDCWSTLALRTVQVRAELTGVDVLQEDITDDESRETRS